jgi:type IV secretory pathway component VirB8
MAVSHSNTRNDLTWAIATLVGIIATLAVNTLSNLIPPAAKTWGKSPIRCWWGCC